jgi:hypothetical protein
LCGFLGLTETIIDAVKAKLVAWQATFKKGEFGGYAPRAGWPNLKR